MYKKPRLTLGRLIFWIKGWFPIVQENRKCRQFCPCCKFYDICKLNEE